jgi:ATP-dependent DNA helicase RecG
MELERKLAEIKGIGPSLQKKLKKLDIETVEDLLFHFPSRYLVAPSFKRIEEIKAGEEARILAKVLEIENLTTWKRKFILTQAILQDNSGSIKAVWFNQPHLLKVIKKESWLVILGKIKIDEYGIYFNNPEYELVSGPNFKEGNLLHTRNIIPIYPQTEGLSSRWLRKTIKKLLLLTKKNIKEWLPQEILKREKILSAKEALFNIHFPSSLEKAKKSKERFLFSEIFLIELFVLKQRILINQKKAPSITFNLPAVKEFLNSLPFQLTLSQKKALFQIIKDLEKERPMNRLLQGDVGSGKTIVAIAASFNVVKAGWQVAFMAPTEILAQQHFQSFLKFLKDFKIRIALLTKNFAQIGEEKVKKKEILEKLKNDEIDILLGTHSLIEEKVKFSKLGLAILDEQHRFGIEQRAKLSSKNKGDFLCHFLSMTATPIPRTLALTLYGDLDISILDQMPKGERKVTTKIVSQKEREKIYQFVREKIREGKKAFVVCPRIEESKNSLLEEVKAVKREFEYLSKEVFPDFKVGMIHGKMNSKETNKIIEYFKAGEIKILVSTSIIEVGVDIPQASILIVESAENFGLAQLHQLRGRIGREGEEAFCFLFISKVTKKIRERLRAILKAKSGFELAELDLKIRGPGEFFGKKQWGLPDVAMEALKNIKLVEKARNLAKEILKKDPYLKNFPLLCQKLKKLKINLQ